MRKFQETKSTLNPPPETEGKKLTLHDLEQGEFAVITGSGFTGRIALKLEGQRSVVLAHDNTWDGVTTQQFQCRKLLPGESFTVSIIK